MSSSLPQIGFDRYVQLAWCRAALDVAIEKMSSDYLRESVAQILPGSESQRKTVDIVKRLWIKPFSTNAEFVHRGQLLYRKLGETSVLPLSWGSAITTYPFFGKVSEFSGRLLSLQGDCSIKEIQRRMAEAYGGRSGIERAVARVLQSQADWRVLKRDEDGKRIIKSIPTMIDNDELTAWLIEAAVRYYAKSVPVLTLPSLPVLFPFTFSRSLVYVISNSQTLELRSDGPSSQSVGLYSGF